MSTGDIIALEKQFWLSNSDTYRRHLADEALMVFADPVGALDREATLASIEAAPRWSGVEFDDVRTLPLTKDAKLLSYRATAWRPDHSEPYVARAASVYVLTGEDWRLAYHQQSV